MLVIPSGHRYVHKDYKTKEYVSKIEHPGAMRYSKELYKELLKLARAWLTKYPQVTGVVSDMSPGWNLALAHAGIQLEREVKVTIPFKVQQEAIHGYWTFPYGIVLEQASYVRRSDTPFSVEHVAAVERRLLRQAQVIVALSDGDRHDPAYNYIYHNTKKAKKERAKVTNLWKSWQKHQEEQRLILLSEEDF